MLPHHSDGICHRGMEAIAVVRQHWWTSTSVDMSPAKADLVELPGALLNRLTDTLCYAA